MSPESISKELKRVQSINKELFDSSPNIIFVKSKNGVYQLANKAMLNCTGLVESEIIGKTDFDFVTDLNSSNTYKEEDDFVLSKGQVLETEPILQKSNNRWYQTVKSPLFDEAGDVTGLLGIMSDVTDIKQNEKKIEEQEKLLSIVFNSSTDFIAVLEPDNGKFKYLSCNDAYLKMLNLFDIDLENDENIKGLEFNNIASEKRLFDQNKIDENYGNLVHVMEAKKSFSTTEIIEIPGDVQKLYIDVEISPILNDDDDEVLYLIYRGRDFSEIMKYNLQLQEREELLQSINRNVQDGIYRSTIGHGLRYANDSMCRMFGYSLAELAKSKPNELYVYKEDRKKIIEELSKTGSFSDREILFKRKDGSSFWALLSCSMTLEADGTRVIDGIVVDTTEERKNREELRTINESLLKTNSELDHLVYRTSHDLRSPLASIMGLMELVRLEGIEGEVAEYISIMEDQVTKLDKVILDIINIRKIAKSGLQRENINCQDLIDGVFESIKFLDRFNEIDKIVNINIESDFVQDKNNVQMILNNVLSNAVKYARKDVAHSFISIDINIDKENCSLVVKDNGIGIKNEYLAQVFNMFYRATSVNQGTGLGLFIVKEALVKLNGSIIVESKEGEWTCFNIEIPNLID